MQFLIKDTKNIIPKVDTSLLRQFARGRSGRCRDLEKTLIQNYLTQNADLIKSRK